MIFTAQTFKDIGFDEVESDAIANIANEKIGQLGVTLFGRVYEGEELVYEDFSTTQKKHDTYKAMVLLSDQLGIVDHHHSALKINKPTEEAKESILKKRNKQLERQVRDNRKENNERV